MEKLTISYQNKTVELSRYILGSGGIGWRISDRDCVDMLEYYYEKGGRSLDSAWSYSVPDSGTQASEKFLGKWLEDNKLRSQFTIVTKGARPPYSDNYKARMSRADIESDFNQSLDAFRTDHIDIYLLHRDAPQIPVGEIMPVLHDLVKSGKTKLIGAANWSWKRIKEANDFALANGLTPFSVSQFAWSIAETTGKSFGDNTLHCMTGEDIKYYTETNMPVMAFSSQALGLFSKVIANPEEHPYDNLRDRLTALLTKQNKLRIEKVRKLSQTLHASPAAICTAYILSSTFPTIALIGCVNKAQLVDSLSNMELRLDRKTCEWLVNDSMPV